jgi:hypothetical protein
MRLFLSIAEGESAASAKTIFATTDQRLINIVAHAFCRRVGAEVPARLDDISHQRPGEPEPGDPERS